MTTSIIVAWCLGAVIGLAIGALVARAVLTSRAAVVSPSGDDAVEETARMGAVLDGLSTGVVIAGADGRITYRNVSARSFTGTHAGVLIDETVERHLAAVRLDGGAAEELLELYGPPKMAVLVRALQLPGGGSFAFVEDISERRRIDAVRTDFVANISHELKTPVGALAVLAETLIDETDPDIVRRIAERLLDESHRAARTIDDLLQLSQIELGGEQVRDGVDVTDIIRCAVERGEALAEQRAIRITVLDNVLDAGRGSTPLPSSLTGDRRQLISAVGNLVENAVKYSEPGGQVQIRSRVEGPWVEFMVADQGVGIPARDLDRIFERFYRVDKARSRGTGGSGLGLAIVRHVATNHGGEVLVSSLEGEGSTFVLRIPHGGDTGPATRGPLKFPPTSHATPTPQRGSP
jgi:two-component system, OmpR family, sensor histidine kinase SenX3